MSASIIKENTERWNRILFSRAARHNDVQKMKKLLDMGADINVKDTNERTPLHIAAVSNLNDSHFDSIEFLLKSGANVNATDKYYYTPFSYAFQNNADFKILQLLLNYGAYVRFDQKETLIRNSFNSKKNTEFLLSKLKSSINADEGLSLMHAAMDCENSAKILKVFIDFGFSVNERTKDGRTLLHRACSPGGYHKMSTIKCLLKYGTDIHAADSRKYTPVLLAVDNWSYCYGHEKLMKKVFKFILEHTNVNKINLDNLESLTPQKFVMHKMIIEHVVKLETLNIPVHPVFLKIITRQVCSNNYFKQCQEELLRAKNAKLKNSWISFYNLLVDGRKKLKNYAGNKDLIKKFNKSNCIEKFTIYGATMIENVEKGLKRRKLFNESVDLLSECLLIFNPTHMVIRDILDCIVSKKDLSLFCKK